MRPISINLYSERAALIDEYRRLNAVAVGALDDVTVRGRPNWGLFYEAQFIINSIVERIREINDG